MQTNIIKTKYISALNSIVSKARELINIDKLNHDINEINDKYCEKINSFDIKMECFINEFDDHREEHLNKLKYKLSKISIPLELQKFVDGDIYDSLKTIDNLIKEDKYKKEIELIIAINVFSSFKSIRTISKKTFISLYEIVNEKNHPLELKIKCPFCELESILSLFKRGKPFWHDLRIYKTSNCNCSFPKSNNYSSSYLKKISHLLNVKEELVLLDFNEVILKELNIFAEENFLDFYMFENDSKVIYDEVKEFKACNIEKEIWAKIKNNNLEFNGYLLNKLKKTPNSLTKGLKINSLNTVIQNLSLDFTYSNFETLKIDVVSNTNNDFDLYKINPGLINYVHDYKQKKQAQDSEEFDKNEVLALGYYCKSENITMENLYKYNSLLRFCKQHNIELHEMQELAVQHGDLIL